jgi:hypothetical protein
MKPVRIILLSLLIVLAGALPKAHASTFLQLESAYEGNGWFRYTVRLPVDPLTDSLVHNISFSPFRGYDTFSVVDLYGWRSFRMTASPDGVNYTYNFNTNYPQIRPITYVFKVHSAYTTFRTSTNYGNATILMNLSMTWESPGGVGSYPINLVGYATFPCLLPCPPAEADGSPATLITDFKIYPDVKLDSLVTTEKDVTGVRFHWQSGNTEPAKYLLEGSRDLRSWTNITEIIGTRGDNTWIAPAPITDRGPFYRIQMVRLDSQRPEAAKLEANPVQPVPLLSVRPNSTDTQVTFESQPGLTYDAQLLDPAGTIIESQQVLASGTNASVVFKPAPVGFIKITPAPAKAE